jgi:LDH2 family malate/lactate/ureidoglycolate dehydrogenase
MASDLAEVSYLRLRDFARRAFERGGLNRRDASVADDILLFTDLRGIGAHGVASLAPFHARGLRDGRVMPADHGSGNRDGL